MDSLIAASKREAYVLLEDGMPGYADYAAIPVYENDEPMAAICDVPFVAARQIGKDMYAYTGNQVFVRSGVLERLGAAGVLLAARMPKAQLEVVYGYRALAIQRRLFEAALIKFDGDVAAAHREIAAPDIAGHPTGGAVDIQIIDGDGEPLDFGTSIWEFTPDSYVFSPFVGERARDNRQLLRDVMRAAGFAPFDGEWWHFSYGDKEWAGYYGFPEAMYTQIELKTTTGVL